MQAHTEREGELLQSMFKIWSTSDVASEIIVLKQPSNFYEGTCAYVLNPWFYETLEEHNIPTYFFSWCVST
jgi:hypothetical protein